MHYVMIYTGKNESIDSMVLHEFHDVDDAINLIESTNCNYNSDQKYWTLAVKFYMNDRVELNRETL